MWEKCKDKRRETILLRASIISSCLSHSITLNKWVSPRELSLLVPPLLSDTLPDENCVMESQVSFHSLLFAFCQKRRPQAAREMQEIEKGNSMCCAKKGKKAAPASSSSIQYSTLTTYRVLLKGPTYNIFSHKRMLEYNIYTIHTIEDFHPKTSECTNI